jgi:hypothetical protein
MPDLLSKWKNAKNIRSIVVKKWVMRVSVKPHLVTLLKKISSDYQFS